MAIRATILSVIDFNGEAFKAAVDAGTVGDAYRRVGLDPSIFNLSRGEMIALKLNDPVLTLVGELITASPLVLKVQVVKKNGLRLGALVWIDATKVTAVDSVLGAVKKKKVGERFRWRFRELVRGLRTLEGTVLEVGDAHMLVRGLDKNGVPSRWRLTDQELELAEDL